jgi:predicted transcriptional regulator
MIDSLLLYDICINDYRLSDAEFGMLIYMIDKSDKLDSINLKIENLANRFSISHERARKRLKKLIEFGYIKRERLRKPSGDFAASKLKLTIPEEYMASKVVSISNRPKGINK